MGAFPWNEVEGICEEEISFPKKCARKLKTNIQNKKPLTRLGKTSQWPLEFAKLAEQHSESEITETLDWYTKHLGDPYVPHAYSGMGFRNKYQQIRAAMSRDPNAVEISAAARLLYPVIVESSKEPDKEMLIVIQRSLDNYTIFYKKFKYFQEHTDHRRLLHFIVYLTSSRHLCSPYLFVAWWIDVLQRKMTNSSGYIISHDKMVFKEDSYWFKNFGSAWAYEFCHNAGLWQQLMEAIK